jgi:CheY-like chemotaxis protein
LSTVHGTIKQCGGHIRVESEPGAGAEFKIYLPAVAETADRPASIDYSADPGGEARVLLVEDEADVRSVVSKMLSVNGFAVVEAADPFHALRLFEQHREQIDLLITDVVMPGMNGKQLYEKIAAANPEIRTLFISAYTDGVIDDLGELRDGVAFLQKPFTPDLLLFKLQQILESRPED